MELLLLKTTNLNLTDIRGRRETHVITEEPRGVMAAIGRVTPHTARAALAGVVALGGLLSVETGLVGPFAVSVGIGLALHYVGQMEASETEITHEIGEPGMTAREVEEFWILNDEHEDLKKKKAEKEARKAEQKAKAKSGGRI